VSINDQHIEAFSVYSSGRASNDELNSLREQLVVVLLNADEEERRSIRRKVNATSRLDEISSALDEAVSNLSNVRSDLAKYSLNSVEPKGGRRFNYDFVFRLSRGSSTVGLKVELKRGDSIFDQPQFLSLYVNSAGVTSSSVPNYAEYFYDVWFPRLKEISGCASVSRDFYLKHVFGTRYEESPFDFLYRFAKASDANRRALSQLQHRSIHDYLTWIKGVASSIDFSNLQARLYEQLEKVFLSWNPHIARFSWEKFVMNELSLVGSIRTKANPSGQISTIILETQTGQELQMLLRWKNNPCVKGPAWQVKLTSPS